MEKVCTCKIVLNADDFPAYLVVYRAVHFVGKDKWFISTPSWCKSHDFNGMPPEKPVRLPFAPTTLWQGMMIEMGLCPTAPPTACADMRSMPRCTAIWRARYPYVTTCPYGISVSILHTIWRNSPPRGAKGKSEIRGFFPSKYLLSQSFVRANTGKWSLGNIAVGTVSPKNLCPAVHKPTKLYPSLPSVICPMGDAIVV